jgi:hypothetical protein
VANLDKWVLVDIAAHKNDGGSRWNGYYYPLILLRQNGSTASFQLEDVLDDSSQSFHVGSEKIQTRQNLM